MAKRKAFALRLTPRIHEAVAAWASDDLRSVNGQIEFLLLESLRRAGRWKAARPAPPGPDEAGVEAADD